MTPTAWVPWFAWLTPRLLLLFGIGFLVANIRLGSSLLAYRRRLRSALLDLAGRQARSTTASTWPWARCSACCSPSRSSSCGARRRSIFGEAMMCIYYGYAFPLSTRIARGFYGDGVWSDSGFMQWTQISAVSWKEEPASRWC